MCEGWISAMTKRIHWFKHRLANVREMNLSHDWTRWMTQERIFGHELKDSLIQTLSRWMKKKKKTVNFSHYQTIHWFKHRVNNCEGSEFQPCSKDSLIQTLSFTICERNEFHSWWMDSLIQTMSHWMKEERISAMIKRFTDSNIDSLYVRGMNLSHDWMIH